MITKNPSILLLLVFCYLVKEDYHNYHFLCLILVSDQMHIMYFIHQGVFVTYCYSDNIKCCIDQFKIVV